MNFPEIVSLLEQAETRTRNLESVLQSADRSEQERYVMATIGVVSALVDRMAPLAAQRRSLAEDVERIDRVTRALRAVLALVRQGKTQDALAMAARGLWSTEPVL